MKITDFKKEDLEKGGLIRRKGWPEDISISFNKSASIFDAYINCAITGEKTDLTFEDIISDDWELVGTKSPKSKDWQPGAGELYYLILTHGFIDYTIYDSDSRVDNERLSFGNCFKTREEAQHMAEKIKIINKLRELSNTKFNEDDDRHYMIAYCKDDGELVSDFCYGLNSIPFNVFFKTREDCENAIDTIGVENLKKYYFDVEE